MKKILLLGVFMSLMISVSAQIQPYVPYRTNGLYMVKDSALAVGKFLIPAFTTPSLGGFADRWGQGFGINTTTGDLNVRSGTGTWLEFPNKLSLGSLYVPFTGGGTITSSVSSTTSNGVVRIINTSINTVNGTTPYPVLTLVRSGVGGTSNDNLVDFGLSRYSTSGAPNANTQFDIILRATNSTSRVNVMSFRSNGFVGIANTAPAVELDVTGTARVSVAPSSATDVVRKTELDLKAPLASPSLTGTPLSTTATLGTNTTQIATTAFVQQEILADRIVNMTTAALSVADLNTAYPSVKVGYRVICPEITGAPAIYTKATEAGSSDVWLTTSATTTP